MLALNRLDLWWATMCGRTLYLWRERAEDGLYRLLGLERLLNAREWLSRQTVCF